VTGTLADGVHNANVVVGQPGTGGRLAAQYAYLGGVPAFTDIYSLALNSLFPRRLGSVGIWGKQNALAWGDGKGGRHFVFRGTNPGNGVTAQRQALADKFFISYTADAGAGAVEIPGITATLYPPDPGWYFIFMTWNYSQNRVRHYYNAVQQDSPATTMAAWPLDVTGDLDSNGCLIGSGKKTGTEDTSARHYGLVSDLMLFPDEKSLAEVQALYNYSGVIAHELTARERIYALTARQRDYALTARSN